MKYQSIIFSALSMILSTSMLYGQRTETLLQKGWEFHKGDHSSVWEKVNVPHDWAITGPFAIENDLQNVAVTQNGEKLASLKTGRTGGLPYVGVGWYRTHFTVPEGKRAELVFDGVMSLARVYVNGSEVIFWPYGYNSFHVDVTPYLVEGDNILEVRTENLPLSSRWYPGAGIYRNVHLLTTDTVHIPVWGTCVRTPKVCPEYAQVDMEIKVDGASGQVQLFTEIFGPDGSKVSDARYCGLVHGSVTQHFIVDKPELWSPEHPNLYNAVTSLVVDGREVDRYNTRFGVRTVEFIPYKGFFLNGEQRKFKGVCNHHDLGPLGAAINTSALAHQLKLLKDMGCDAVRTSHNMPAPELVRLCDEMGLMMMVEPFDEWDVAKCTNGYHLYFDEWAEKDMMNMLHQFRNNPSVVMWSIGNEVPTQCSPDGYRVARFLQDICHREDPTRLCTCGMDRVDCILPNGFGAMIDVPGLNYRTFRYKDAFEALPQGFVLGSETASTVSSRGVYKLPAQKRFSAVDDDHQCSAYDLDACSWSNVPDIDFALADAYPWTLGQFVWTGFDYLGEPSPYDKNAWPNHSSMFGIIDLASIPKDRFYLYRSVWNKVDHTLHLLPHWNWNGHEGELIPIYVYTDSPSAELFLNGVSQGVRTKEVLPADVRGLQDEKFEQCYRLRWDVPYTPGELSAVALDAQGRSLGKVSICTAGRPHHLVLEPSRREIVADGADLCYVTVSVVDKNGNLCPGDARELYFKVKGAANFMAAANGDPTCLDAFNEPHMHCFGGKLTVILRSGESAGVAALEVGGQGIKPSKLTVDVIDK